ncbi:Ribosome maturation factor [Quillaja saponaria]|uniref:Ribosome maturation factor n=1 Tax=Quillaja saponaria TaxID=32244 RepID=A0AAD7L9U4_QUISA|nr:Ribosome maturation factor [Quillaja saponaria]
MHRQSLGSPSSKLHSHGGGKEEIVIVEEPKRRDSVSSSLHIGSYDEDHNNKTPKSHRLSSPPSKPASFIHLIPILILLCFLILYLCSHSPSQSDLAQFNGFKRSSKLIDSAVEMNDIGRYTAANRGGFLAIRSLHNLQEIRKDTRKSRTHRKFADF